VTTFWREGFWRTNAYGNTYWVERHLVERDNWDRGGAGFIDFHKELADARAHLSATARYVNPNADCPVCGQPVFFFQNEYGSRVYFDELGPPWPKHPCTNHAEYQRPQPSSSAKTILPTSRDANEINFIACWLPLAGLDPQHEFLKKYGAKQWSVWQIDGRYRGSAGVLLVLRSLNTAKPRRLFLLSRRLPVSIKSGALVFFNRNLLAGFDLVSMEPVEVQAQRLGSASAFVEALIQKRSASRASGSPKGDTATADGLNVAHFATALGLPTSLLLEQLQAAGISKKQESDSISEQDKTKLLDHLRQAHNAD